MFNSSGEDGGLSEAKMSIELIETKDVPKDVVSAIGHADTAAVVSDVLGRQIEANRVGLNLEWAGTVYIAQYVGNRLPEGVTKLPEGAEIRFYRVEFETRSQKDILEWGTGVHPYPPLLHPLDDR